MYYKIALRTVKKSFKDYTVYFLTLTFAICIFYSFNSIDAQKTLLNLNLNQEQYMKIFSTCISMASIFVSFILGGLIIYTNNFLIKNRKQEIGTYMILGMSKRKISNILLIESTLIGIISLGIGLGLGIVLSQGLSILTARLFIGSMIKFGLIFSVNSILKTILYFGLIFLLVIIFNIVIISKYKLRDLLNTSKKNEKVRIKNPIVLSIIFIISIVIIITSYILISKSILDITSTYFQGAIALGTIGTFLFFYGLSGVILYIIKKRKSIYLKNLNIFIVRQISNKFNTNFVAMSMICLMLFAIMTTASCSLGFRNTLEWSVKNTTPFDGSIQVYYCGQDLQQIYEINKKINSKISNYKDKVYIAEYKLEGININNMLAPYMSSIIRESIDGNYGDGSDTTKAISISQYNNMRKLEGLDKVELKNNEVLVISDIPKIRRSINEFIRNNKQININGKQYKIKNKRVIQTSILSSGMSVDNITLVVPNSVVENLIPYTSYININYVGNSIQRKIQENNLGSIFNSMQRVQNQNPNYKIVAGTRIQLYQAGLGLSATVIYVSIYVSSIFLITSAAILALQQLSEASDNINRYRILKKMGFTDKMINRSIFIQTFIYFAAPLLLAIIHWIVAIYVVNSFVLIFGDSNIINAAMVALIFIIIYSGYFYVTYTNYKRIIKNNK